MSFPMKPVEDYDVDRRDVEAQQCVKLTRTNWLIVLTIYPEFIQGLEIQACVNKYRIQSLPWAGDSSAPNQFSWRQQLSGTT